MEHQSPPAVRRTILFVAVIALLGCTKKASKADFAGLAGTQDFAFHLLAQLVSDSAAKNVVISPVSVEMCLAMAANGAGGKTQSEIAGVLGTPATELDRLNRANAALLGTLTGSSRSAKLAIANSIWGRKGLEFTKPFLDMCSRDYSASARALDFASPTAVREINGWVADKTHGLIPPVIGSLNANEVALLLNAVYFRGRWAKQFDPKFTKARPFHLTDGSIVERRMMSLYAEFGYLRTDSFSAAALPFANHRFCMYVFVPDDTSGLPGFLRKLSEYNWRRWMSEFRTGEVDIGLPRFTIRYDASLKASLMALGMATAFDSAHADFTPMVAKSPLQPVWLDDAVHTVFIEVNEEGARAAAVAVSMAAGGSPGRVIADHPFFFAIVDTWSDAILFMGAVYDPPQ